MRKFLKKVLMAAVFFPFLVVNGYFVLHFMSMKSNTYNNDCIFVWGDSQMYQDLDVLLFGNRMGKQVLTSAVHGSGVYDFLVSEKSIPNNAICIVSFPEGTLLRNPISDNNRTGFELSSLQLLFWAGCPLDECLRIANLNRQNVYYKPFGKIHYMCPYSDSIVFVEPLTVFCGMFTEEKDYF